MFHCLVSTSPHRNPLRIEVVASDEAEAAFFAAVRLGFPCGRCLRPTHPWVRLDGGSWLVTTGWTTYRVAVLPDASHQGD